MEQELRNQDLAVDLYQNALKVREGGREGVRAGRRNDSPCNGSAGEYVVLTHLSLPPSLLQAFPNSSHTYQAWACLEKERGNWDLAFSLFRSGIEKRPWDGGAYQPYALALKERGEMTSAMEVFQRGLQEDPYHCPLYQVRLYS